MTTIKAWGNYFIDEFLTFKRLGIRVLGYHTKCGIEYCQ